MKHLIILVCLGLVALTGVTQAVAGPQAASKTFWYRQYPTAPGNPLSVTCPSASVCYAAGTDGAVLRSANAGGTWQGHHAPIPAGFAIRAIACRTDDACLASADDRGGSFRTVVLATNNGGRTWHKRLSTVSGGTNGLACPLTGDCFLLLRSHFFAISSGGGVSKERDLPLPATTMFADGLACPAPDTCYVDANENRGDGYGAVLVTTDGGLFWQTHLIRPNRTHGIFTGISCPTPLTCYVVNNKQSSGVLVTHDAWKTNTFHPIDLPRPPASNPDSGYFAQPVCPTDNACYLRSTFGPIVSTTDGGQSWNEHALDRPALPFSPSYLLPLGVAGMACPTSRHCVAVQVNGNIVLTNNSGSSWSTVFIGTARSLSGVACAGPTSCFAVGPDGTLLATSDASTWTRRPYPLGNNTNTLIAIACHGSSICVAAGTGGSIVGTRDGGATWKRSAIPIAGKDQVILRTVACPSSTTCYVAGYAYATGGPGVVQVILFRTVDAGTTWRSLALPAKTWLVNAIACASTRICLVGSGDASDDDSYPAGSLLLTRNGGATWNHIGSEAYFGIACPGGNACEVVGQSSGRMPLAIRVSLSGKVLARWQGADQRFFRDSLTGVACTGLGNCYAVGDAGLVAHTGDSSHWTTAALGLESLTAAACTRATGCTAVGSQSTIVSTRAGETADTPIATATPMNSGSNHPLPTPTPPPVLPAPTQVPAGPGCPPKCVPGMILYHANWTHGLDGWTTRNGGTGSWRTKDGALVSPPVTYQHPATLIRPPFQPGPHGIANYAVQFQARPVSQGIGFQVSIRRQGQRYDDFSASGCCTNTTNLSIIYRDEGTRAGYDTIIGDAHLPPIDARWHTYRLEVQGEMLRFIVDGRPLIRGLDRHVLAGGEVDLRGLDVPIRIRDFTIVSL